MSGKSLIAKRLCSYLLWMGYSVKVFSSGKTRSQASWSSDEDALAPAWNTVDTMTAWFRASQQDHPCDAAAEGRIGILDDYCFSRAIRRETRRRFESAAVDVLFLESYIDDPQVMEAIFAAKMETLMFKRLGEAEVRRRAEIRRRIVMSRYETLGQAEQYTSHIKMVNQGNQLVLTRLEGYVPGQICLFLANCHTFKRKIWLSRHGESELNVLGRLGGDPALTKKGRAYALALADLLKDEDNLEVYTSTLIRTHQTIAALKKEYNYHETRLLNEIYAGECELMTYKEIEEQMPLEHAMRAKDKFLYRYPKGGESYMDLVERLKPMIIELERQRSAVLVVSHQAIMRVLLSYFCNDIDQSNCCHFEVPHNRVVEITPTGYGYTYRFIEVDIEPFMSEVPDDRPPPIPGPCVTSPSSGTVEHR